MEKQGSFKLLRSFLGSIAGGISSLATLPFAKRKSPEASLLIQPPPAPPTPFTGFDHDGNSLSKLYPDMELSESRKRARLSCDGVLEEKGECSNGKQKHVRTLGEPSGEGSGETSDVCITPILLNTMSDGADATFDECDETTLGSGVSQGGNTTSHILDHSDDLTRGGVLHVGNMTTHTHYGFDVVLHVENNTSDEKMASEHKEMLHDLGDDSNDNLASFKRTLVARKIKMKQKKRGQESVKEEETPRKRVRFGATELGLSSDVQSSLTSSVHGTGMSPKKSVSSTKRKWDETEEKNEKKLRALSLSEEPVHTEGKTPTVGMAGVSTRKRERVDDEGAHVKSIDEQLELQTVVLVQNLPLNASRKAINREFSKFGSMESMQLCSVFFLDEKSQRKPTNKGEINKTPNSQNAQIVYKNELSAVAALAHNMKEFNGNILRVTATCVNGTSKEIAPTALCNTRSIFVSNIPIDAKDEELFQLFGGGGSFKLDVEAVRVTRDSNTGLSKGTAHVFFKTEADMNRLLSSRRTLKLREQVLYVSPTVGNMPQQRLTQPRLAKRSITLEADTSGSHEKRVKLSSPHEAITISKKLEHQERQTTYTRSKQSNLGVPKEHSEVSVSASHVYVTRHVAASIGQSENSEKSPEAKRKREENRQRGTSRSKMIRRT